MIPTAHVGLVKNRAKVLIREPERKGLPSGLKC